MRPDALSPEQYFHRKIRPHNNKWHSYYRDQHFRAQSVGAEGLTDVASIGREDEELENQSPASEDAPGCVVMDDRLGSTNRGSSEVSPEINLADSGYADADFELHT